MDWDISYISGTSGDFAGSPATDLSTHCFYPSFYSGYLLQAYPTLSYSYSSFAKLWDRSF
jgi:hypothetical protein